LAASVAAPALTLLLPERRRFAGQPLGADAGRRLGRADRPADGAPGEAAQLQRHFDLLPRGWPVAAITRALDADDAPLHQWLRADPAHVRPDMSGARVLAIGELGLTRDEAEALARPLRPLFGDVGFQLSVPHPSRWYVALPMEAKVPPFAAPEDVLGDDLLAHLPAGPEGLRWRALLNEAQILLHNHPVNEARVAAGKPAVNSLCFWGAGKLPDRVLGRAADVRSEEPTLLALAKLAAAATPAGQGVLLDLRARREWASVADVLREAMHDSDGAEVRLDFADGALYSLRAGQRFRFWRRSPVSLA
jgi:hypothetical protein